MSNDGAEFHNKVQAAINQVGSDAAPHANLIKLSSGVVLALEAVSVLKLRAVVEKFKFPDIPEIYDESLDRKVKNEDSPEYKTAVDQTLQDRGLATLDAIIVFGTKIVSVPDNVDKLESEDWIDACEFMGITIDRNNKFSRYLSWVKFVAIKENTDWSELASQFGISVGASGENVAEAMSTFRNNP